MITQDDVFRIGRIGKAHGVKGEVVMFFDDDVFDRTDADYVMLDIDGTFVPFFFEEYRFRTDETALVKFDGIDTADAARRLTGAGVFFERRLSPAEDGEEWTWNELVGFHLLDEKTGQPIGQVKGIDLTTINTLLEVVTPEGKEVLIPAVDNIITGIDRNQRTITAALPEGLLEL